MANIDYLSSYDNCIEYCGGDLLETEEDKDECVQDIRRRFGRDDLCLKQQSESCEILRNPNFKNLITFLVNLFKIQYCARYYYSNIFDIFIITTLGSLNLQREFGIEISQLSCVKLKDFVKEGMPSNMADYFTVMNEIQNIIESGKDIMRESAINPVLKNYLEFVSDFQPWTTLLLDCVDKYSRELLLLPNGLPDIRNKSSDSYKEFISLCDKEKLQELLHSDHSTLINYIKSMATTGGRRIRKKRRITKRKKSIQRKKSRRTKRSRSRTNK
jgi:hypothetical protein